MTSSSRKIRLIMLYNWRVLFHIGYDIDLFLILFIVRKNEIFIQLKCIKVKIDMPESKFQVLSNYIPHNHKQSFVKQLMTELSASFSFSRL